MFFSAEILQWLVLVASLSTDAFAASLSCGGGGIAIPPRSVAVISGVCSGMLALSMLAGQAVSGLIPTRTAQLLCFWLLLGIGVMRLFDNYLKTYIRRNRRLRLHFSAFDLNFILTVYADADQADVDRSKVLSPREAGVLAAALSLDGLAVGFGAAFSGVGPWGPCLVSLCLTALAVHTGQDLGRRLRGVLPFDLSSLSAVLLIALAFLRLG